MNDTQANDAGIAERGAERQFLSFLLGDEAYGVDILRVQEIRGWTPVRALPDVPDYVKGVLDLRGVIVPVMPEFYEPALEELERLGIQFDETVEVIG